MTFSRIRIINHKTIYEYEKNDSITGICHPSLLKRMGGK